MMIQLVLEKLREVRWKIVSWCRREGLADCVPSSLDNLEAQLLAARTLLFNVVSKTELCAIELIALHIE